MKKIILILIGIAFIACALVAENYFSVNDLEPASLKEKFEIDDVFSVYATSEKGVTIEALTGDNPERLAEDGEVFNARLKLNGSGKVDYRSIHFEAKKGETIKVYTNSSSSSADRTLLLVNVATGATVAELKAPADGKNCGISTCQVNENAEYALYSSGSGINIYQIVIE